MRPLCALFMAIVLVIGIPGLSRAEEEPDVGRYQLKNLLVKSYYMNDQGELTRWSDKELIRVDTVTGKAWRWVSERSRDKKTLREYWKEMAEGDRPMSAGSR